MTAPPTLKEVLLSLYDPWSFLFRILSHFPQALKTLFRTSPRSLTSPSTIFNTWFATFWRTFGPELAASVQPKIRPLLLGHPDAEVAGEPKYAPLSGLVLEVGAGSGMHAEFLTSLGASKVLAVEPNPAQIAALRARVDELGLQGKYEGVPVGIQDLNVPGAWEGMVQEESVDCIVTILCLCSIPEPEENCKALWKLLKPGGRWFVYEHVVTHRESGWGMRIYQRFVNLFWPGFLGGCELCRDTESNLRNAGEWTAFDMRETPNEPWCQVVPHIQGILVK